MTDATPGWCFWQGILWKRSGSSLNKEWKKKYVTLSNNGTLSYHSSSSVRKHHNTDQCDSKRAGGREDLQLFTFKGTGYAFRLFLLLVFERKTHSYLLHLQKFRYSSRIHEMWCYLHHILIQLFKSGPFEKKTPHDWLKDCFGKHYRSLRWLKTCNILSSSGLHAEYPWKGNRSAACDC